MHVFGGFICFCVGKRRMPATFVSSNSRYLRGPAKGIFFRNLSCGASVQVSLTYG